MKTTIDIYWTDKADTETVQRKMLEWIEELKTAGTPYGVTVVREGPRHRSNDPCTCIKFCGDTMDEIGTCKRLPIRR